ncbi:MAG: Lhr family helicase, partial [Acidimicrobiales bacterium]
VRRGYFVAGMGGAQFALPGAVDRLRDGRQRSGTGGPGEGGAVVLAATDPANVYGLTLPWPVSGPRRVAGAYVVLVGEGGALYVERGARGLVALRELDGTWEHQAVAALDDLVTSGRMRRLAVERFDEALAPVLRAAGFVPSPRGLVRYG